jgi:hypothetical protein
LSLARGQYFCFKISIVHSQNILSHNVFVVSSTGCNRAAAFLGSIR